MIVEGILTTLCEDGRTNIAPMGPTVDPLEAGDLAWRRLVLRPFRTSTTYQNLRRLGQAVFHVTDDVELLARAAIGALDPSPPLAPVAGGQVPRLADTCRWYALEVESIDEQGERSAIVARVTGEGRLRDFVGFNRAKHAIVEAAILATRVGLVPRETIESQLTLLRSWVDKTGDEAEQRAFELLRSHVQKRSPPL